MFSDTTAFTVGAAASDVYDFVRDPLGSLKRVQQRVIDAVTKFDQRYKALPVAQSQMIAVREMIKKAPARDAAYARMLQGQYDEINKRLVPFAREGQVLKATVSKAIAKVRELAESLGFRSSVGAPVAAIAIAAAAIAIAVPLTRWAVTADGHYRSISTLLNIAKDRSNKWTEAERKAAFDAAIKAGGNPDPFSLSGFFSQMTDIAMIAVLGILFVLMIKSRKAA